MARIVRFHEYGDASVLKIENLDVPPPAADEVQIEVKSIGLNRAEVMFRTHAYLQEAQFPSRLGFEAAGIIKTVGTSVTSFKKGDVVSVIPPPDIARWGTYGESANVLARNLVKHPRNISFEEAAASWMQYLTAWGAFSPSRCCQALLFGRPLDHMAQFFNRNPRMPMQHAVAVRADHRKVLQLHERLRC